MRGQRDYSPPEDKGRRGYSPPEDKGRRGYSPPEDKGRRGYSPGLKEEQLITITSVFVKNVSYALIYYPLTRCVIVPVVTLQSVCVCVW